MGLKSKNIGNTPVNVIKSILLFEYIFLFKIDPVLKFIFFVFFFAFY